jgi:hypothetical protein
MAKREWKLIGHSHAIADTGDYSGEWEITDGHTSFFNHSDENDEEEMQVIVDALNAVHGYFYTNFENDCDFYKSQIDLLKTLNPPQNEQIKDRTGV